MDDFVKLSQELNFNIIEISQKIADVSSTLRARYHFLKGMDALQIATAVHLNCKEFFTNDRTLKPITEIKIILVEELI